MRLTTRKKEPGKQINTSYQNIIFSFINLQRCVKFSNNEQPVDLVSANLRLKTGLAYTHFTRNNRLELLTTQR